MEVHLFAPKGTTDTPQTSQGCSTVPGMSGFLWVGQMETLGVFKAQDSSPSVVIGDFGVFVDGVVEHQGDLVETFLQGNAEAAIFERESAIGFAAFAVRVVVVFPLGDKFPVDEDPGVAEPAELDEFVLHG